MTLDRKRALAPAVAALLIASCAWQVLPVASRLTRLAVRVARLPIDARRAVVLGEFWPSLRAVERRLPDARPVAIVMRHVSDVDRGAFVACYLYPRVCRYYFGIDQYRYDTTAARPSAIAYLDLERDERVRSMTYEELRAEEFGRRAIVPSPAATSAPLREFAVPLVASIDGPPPDVYKTEAVLVADEDTPVVLTLQPGGSTKTLVLHARQPRILRDAVFELSGRLDRGWLHVQASASVRCGFWFVNAGTGSIAATPPRAMRQPATQTIAGGETLWLANLSPAATTVRINGEPFALQPHALQSMRAAAVTRLEGGQSVIAFTTAKLPGGGSEFHWAEEAR